MADKLTSLKGFGEGDPKPEKSAKSKALKNKSSHKKGFGDFGSDRYLRNLENKTLGQRTKAISGPLTFGIERSYRKRLAKDLAHKK